MCNPQPWPCYSLSKTFIATSIIITICSYIRCTTLNWPEIAAQLKIIWYSLSFCDRLNYQKLICFCWSFRLRFCLYQNLCVRDLISFTLLFKTETSYRVIFPTLLPLWIDICLHAYCFVSNPQYWPRKWNVIVHPLPLWRMQFTSMWSWPYAVANGLWLILLPLL